MKENIEKVKQRQDRGTWSKQEQSGEGGEGGGEGVEHGASVNDPNVPG